MEKRNVAALFTASYPCLNFKASCSFQFPFSGTEVSNWHTQSSVFSSPSMALICQFLLCDPVFPSLLYNVMCRVVHTIKMTGSSLDDWIY
jgi:hypothetical protein